MDSKDQLIKDLRGELAELRALVERQAERIQQQDEWARKQDERIGHG